MKEKKESDIREGEEWGGREKGRNEGRKEKKKEEGREKQKSNLEENIAKGQKEIFELFQATEHLTKNINTKNRWAEKQDDENKNKKGDWGSKETNWGPKPHDSRTNAKVRAKNR